VSDINYNQLRAEIREDLLREQAAEAERQRINGNTFTKVVNEFNDEFTKVYVSRQMLLTNSTCLANGCLLRLDMFNF